MLEMVLGFFCWYPDGPATLSPLEMESESVWDDSLGLFRVGWTDAVLGTEDGPAPAWLLVSPDVVGVEDTEVTTGPLVEA